MTWAPGTPIVRREVRNDGSPWCAIGVIVVHDSAEMLVSFIPSQAPIASRPDHPWHRSDQWHGHGVLMLQRPDEPYAVWHFWREPGRRFDCWYLNLQEPFRRSSAGYDTQDLELDIVISPDGSWIYKDDELLEQRVAEGRFTDGQVRDIRAVGRGIAADLDAGRQWWDDRWVTWVPDPSWPTPTIPDDWASLPT